ncbi:MAG: hypothetical protein K8I30_22790 [Anaerolineae bacterium]|nr:hypothetical protein [Anaerolineae bacterium]
MSTIKSFNPDVEVSGEAIIAVIQCLNRAELMPILEKYELGDVQPDQWYPVMAWIDALCEIEDQDSGSMNLVAATIRVAETTLLVSEEGTIKDVFMHANDTYYLNHRGGYLGEISVESSKAKEIVISAYSPYPDDYLYGTFYGQAHRCAPPNANLRIYRDQPYVYRIAW